MVIVIYPKPMIWVGPSLAAVTASQLPHFHSLHAVQILSVGQVSPIYRLKRALDTFGHICGALHKLSAGLDEINITALFQKPLWKSRLVGDLFEALSETTV